LCVRPVRCHAAISISIWDGWDRMEWDGTGWEYGIECTEKNETALSRVSQKLHTNSHKGKFRYQNQVDDLKPTK